MIADVRGLLNRHDWRALPSDSLKARFAVGAFWSTIAAGASRAMMLAAAVVCGRLLGRTGFGEVGMIQSTAGMFGVFAGLNLGLTATRYVAEFRHVDQARAGRILALSGTVAVLSGAAMSLALVFGAPYLATRTLAAPHLAGTLAVGGGLIFFGALNGVQTGALAGFEAFKRIAQVTVWAGVIGFVFVVAGVRLGGVRGAVWGYVGSLAVNWLLNHIVLRRECARHGIKPSFRDCWREWPVFLHFSVPAFLSSALVAPTLFACNAFMVSHPDGYSQLGLFTAADRWRAALLFLPSSVMQMVFPMLFNLKGEQNSQGYTKVFRANFLVSSLAVLAPGLVIACLSPFIMALYGSSYRAGWPVLMVLALAAVPQCLNSVFGQPVVTRSMWLRLAFDFVLTGTLLGIAWWLIPRKGSLGLALAYLIAYSITTVGLLVVVREHLGAERRTS